MTVRRLERGYVCDVPGEMTTGGYPLVIHLADRHDDTPQHRMYLMTGYDSRCGWCWLGAPHSEAAHTMKVR